MVSGQDYLASQSNGVIQVLSMKTTPIDVQVERRMRSLDREVRRNCAETEVAKASRLENLISSAREEGYS